MLDMFDNAYFLSWIVYLVSAVLLFVVVWKMTAWMGDFFRKLTRGLIAVLVLTPFFGTDSLSWLKPAFPVASYEFLFGDMALAQQALRSILVAVTILLALLLLETIVWLVFLDRRDAA